MDFRSLADQALNQTVLVVESSVFRICEIEFYVNGPGHPDGYCHRCPEQETWGSWYFHRSGGTRKGLDITLGSPGQAASILIRSIWDGSSMTEGPSKVVDRILSAAGVSSVSALTGSKVLSTTSSRLRLVWMNLSPEQIWTSRRVGLSEKYPEFRNLEYRFLIWPNQIRKQKTGLRMI